MSQTVLDEDYRGRDATHDTSTDSVVIEDEPAPGALAEQPSLEALHASEPPVDSRTMRKRVFNLAWPVIGENLLETLLMIVDTWMVAALGGVALAGVGGAVQVMFFVLSALTALAIGSSVLVAQAFGAKDLGRASNLARQSLIWSVVLSIPLALAGLLFAAPVITLFGMEPEVSQISTDYLQVTMGSVVVLIGLFIGGGVLRGVGDSRTPMLITAIANVINVGVSYTLIYGHLGLPALGAVGSAWGTFLARAIALCLLLWVLWKGRNGVSIRGRGNWRPNLRVVSDVLNIGIPAALEHVLISAAFFVFTIVVAQLGTAALAAHRISFTALTFAFLPGIGFGMAATALVGQSIGAKRPSEGVAAARIATQWAVIWMSAIAALFLVAAAPIMRLFTDDPAVVEMGAASLRVVALAQPFWAVLFVQAGGLRGGGNTRFPLVVSGGGMWVSVVIGALLVVQFNGGLVVTWIGFLVVAPFIAWLHWWRFHGMLAPKQPSAP